MTADLFGGPWPLPSCAIATVVIADDRIKRVAMVYFILIILGCSRADGALAN